MGQIGSAMTNPNTFAAQPSGFSGAEWATRFMGAGAKGLGQGLQNNMQQRSVGPGANSPMPMTPQQPPVEFPTQGVQMGQSKRANNPMFYGYGGE